ncbi:hypothetical protein ACNHKD_17500 [Methylocystis sp. JAN1]|uniref:hypothetical protein n=1 Tax=Methylocystis sp. JAN1 TaxID=3397211 RepID=UPI003FA21AD4
MDITLDEAIDIYARALCAWRKEEAHRDARNEALAYRAIGDEEGYRAWSRVAEKAAILIEERRDDLKRKV